MNDFDFLIGTWNVHNRKLDKALAGCDEWQEFPGISTCVSAFEGAGNYDEIVFPTKGTRGLTLLYSLSGLAPTAHPESSSACTSRRTSVLPSKAVEWWAS